MERTIESKAGRASDPQGASGAPGTGGPRGGDPLYIRVARTLKDEIVGGTWPVGAQLPTEDELCTRFAVSRYTVREALRRLREEGLVASRQGAGTVVVPPRASDSYVLNTLSISDLMAFASGTRFEIEAIRMAPVDAKLAARIGVEGGTEWLAVTGYRHDEASDAPLCRTEYYIHRDYASVGRLLQRHNGPIFPLIEDLFALTITEVHQDIAATIIPPALADGLKVKAGSAALEVCRTYRIDDGKIAQITINTYPASRFRHTMTLKRVKA